MSEKLENQNFANNGYLQKNELSNAANNQFDVQQREDFMNGLADYVIERYNNKQTAAENRKKFIESSLADYDQDRYFKNQDFINLYSEAVDVLGDEIDTKKFIELLDKYVDSRIAFNNKVRSAEDENSSVTDSLAYDGGTSGKPKEKRRFQDLTPEELPKYIAKYI